MRRPRLDSLAIITVVVLLTACSSSHHSSRSSPSSSTTETGTSTSSSVSTTSEPTTLPPSSSPGTTSTVSALGGPRIVSLTGPPTPVPCNAPTSVELHWETRGANRVELRVNGGTAFTYTSGRYDELVPLACDGTTQTYQLTARATNGQTATRTLKLTERATS